MYNLNVVNLDYLTLTTFTPDIASRMGDYVKDLRAVEGGKKRMQYVGYTGHHESGTAFVGSATQRKRQHHMLQVSGLLSENAFHVFERDIAGGLARITRLDLQLTVEYPRNDWSQAAVFATVRKNAPNRSVSYAESQSGPQGTKLATVYFGSRTSDRVTRLYEKMGMGDEVFLRFETEFKGKRCRAIGQELAKGLSRSENLLAAEILRFPHDGVQLVFIDFILDPRDIKLEKASGNTKRWLLETVIPSLDRFLNDHDATETTEVADLFFRVLVDHLS